jgi:hypothetical protein
MNSKAMVWESRYQTKSKKLSNSRQQSVRIVIYVAVERDGNGYPSAHSWNGGFPRVGKSQYRNLRVIRFNCLRVMGILTTTKGSAEMNER